MQLRVHVKDSSLRPRVYFDGEYLGEANRLDLQRNATRRRRKLRVDPTPVLEPTGLDPLGDLEREHYQLDDEDHD